MEKDQIIEELINLLDLHNIYDRGDYIDGFLDGLEMAIEIIKKSG